MCGLNGWSQHLDKTPLEVYNELKPIDCACVIYGDRYSWSYVDRLYNMLSRHSSRKINLHVYTEANRVVPSPMIKHTLAEWPISGPKQLWWYKMQLFNPQQHSGPMLYFDLDVVITKSIDWIYQLPLEYFWTVRDFKYLWRPATYNINSSIMWWDTTKYSYVYDRFIKQDLKNTMGKYRGDQDYLNDVITQEKRRLFDTKHIQSWRWQSLDGGYNFSKRLYNKPGTGTVIPHQTSVLIFHGDPKPDQVTDPVIVHYWQ